MALNLVRRTALAAGAALAAHPGIDFISFTGSNEVGTLVQQAAALNHVPVTLELGGKSPQIVFEDANLNRALPFLVNGGIQNAGQTCSCGARILVQRSRMDEVVSRGVPAEAAPKVQKPRIDPEVRHLATAKVQEALDKLEAEIGEGHGKASAGAAAALRAVLKVHGKHIDNALEQQVLQQEPLA